MRDLKALSMGGGNLAKIKAAYYFLLLKDLIKEKVSKNRLFIC
jgi:hypothetical protein